MSVKGEIKEAAGYVKEEAFEHGKSAGSRETAHHGRDLHNEGASKTENRQRRQSPALES